MAFIRQHINILFVFVLPVYLYIVQNSIQNKHTHVYANGIVVTHSHPVDNEEDAPISEHNHSKTEISLFSSLNIDFYDITPINTWHVKPNEVSAKHVVQNEDVESSFSFLKSVPRGPPA